MQCLFDLHGEVNLNFFKNQAHLCIPKMAIGAIVRLVLPVLQGVHKITVKKT
jgi:hypothetical protein